MDENKILTQVAEILDEYLPANGVGTEREKQRISIANGITVLFKKALKQRDEAIQGDEGRCILEIIRLVLPDNELKAQIGTSLTNRVDKFLKLKF